MRAIFSWGKLDTRIVSSIRGEYGILSFCPFYPPRGNIMLICMQGVVSLGFDYHYLPSIFGKGSIWGGSA